MLQSAWPTQNTWVEKWRSRGLPWGNQGLSLEHKQRMGSESLKCLKAQTLMEFQKFTTVDSLFHLVSCWQMWMNVRHYRACVELPCVRMWKAPSSVSAPTALRSLTLWPGAVFPLGPLLVRLEIKVYLTDGCWPHRKVMGSNHSWCGQLPSVRCCCFKQQKTVKHRS